MILERTAPNGRLLGIDLSEIAISNLKSDLSSFGKRLVMAKGNFKDIKKLVYDAAMDKPRGILMDLGFSSNELSDPRLGLSFQLKGPLDMRLGGEGITAAEIINSSKEAELTRIISSYGEERFASRIAKAIVIARKKKRIITTTELVDVIVGAVSKNYERGRIHPATRTFQALRIAVNDELENLSSALPQALELLPTGGRLVIISFHSLEDRIVKRFFREQSGNSVRILTKKPIQAGEEEVRRNPRARSAKLRAVEKI